MTEHEQSGLSPVEDVEKERRHIVVRENAFAQERHPAHIAGGEDDEVHLVGRSIGEDDPAPAELLEVGAHFEVAMSEGMENLRIHHRVGFEDCVIRLRQTEPGDVAIQQAEQALKKPAFDEVREVRPRFVEHVGRLSEDVLGNEVVAPAQAYKGLVRRPAGVAGNVAARVPRSHDEHTPAFELPRVLVLARVEDLALEGPVEGRNERRFFAPECVFIFMNSFL